MVTETEMFNVDFYIIIWIMFFCCLQTVGFWSIFTFILSFQKNKYQIHSYTTFNMDDFNTICIYENLLVFAYFLIDWMIYLISLGNPTFSTMFPHSRHVLKTFELWMLCACLYLFVVYFSFAPVISVSIHRYVNYFDIQVLMMVTETETLMSTLHHNKFNYLDYVFLLPSLIILFFSIPV